MYEQLDLFPPDYEPEVDHYVVWERDVHGVHAKDEGWVYFKCPPSEPPKKGFTTQQRYITIETSIKPKHPDEYTKGDRHKLIHTLLLCFESQWHELRYVKKRESNHIQHWSQYDDIAGNGE